MPINDNDSFQPLKLPPLDSCWPELQPLVQEYRKHEAALRAAEHRLGGLENDQHRAEEKDNLAYAKAIREGKPEPGNKHADALVADRKQTRKDIAALKAVLEEIENEIAEVFDDTKDEQLATIGETIDEALVAYEAEIDTIASSRFKLASAVAMRNFLEGFSEDPEGKGYRTNEWPLWKLAAKYGESAGAFGEVVEALRFDRQVINNPAEVQRLFSRMPGPLSRVQPGLVEFELQDFGNDESVVQMTT